MDVFVNKAKQLTEKLGKELRKKGIETNLKVSFAGKNFEVANVKKPIYFDYEKEKEDKSKCGFSVSVKKRDNDGI